MSIYQGIRGKKFKYFLKQILSLSRLRESYINVLLDQNGIELYNNAFTHKTADNKNNYEFLEFLGDVTLNKSIGWYLSRRFPKLNCADGVKVLTRLKINLISKRSFAFFAKKFLFWDFISADIDTRNNKMDKTLEDVFEAFFGATELLIDSKIRIGAGYSICYNIISNMLDTQDISLKYEDLFDAKTRLKETFDHFGTKIGSLKYDTKKVDRIHHVTVKQILDGNNKELGYGTAPLKSDAQQYASLKAIDTLKDMGFFRPLPDNYKIFCD